jgi:hypothetical protein
MKMKKSILAMFAWALLVMASSAMAYPVTAGDTVTMLSGDTAAQYEGHYQFKVGSGAATYGTFCVELNEYFNPGSTYTVKSIDPYASGGGVGGVTGGIDPLSDATKWLFYHYLAKDIQTATGSAENDYSMQLAIWKLEDELGASTQGYLNEYNADAVAQDYVSDAMASGSAGAGFDVMVMNLVSSDGSNAQSQLVGAAPVPEPGTMMLLGFGLFVLAVYGKRRMNIEP